jgi:hypothetical protein
VSRCGGLCDGSALRVGVGLLLITLYHGSNPRDVGIRRVEPPDDRRNEIYSAARVLAPAGVAQKCRHVTLSGFRMVSHAHMVVPHIHMGHQ